MYHAGFLHVQLKRSMHTRGLTVIRPIPTKQNEGKIREQSQPSPAGTLGSQSRAAMHTEHTTSKHRPSWTDTKHVLVCTLTCTVAPLAVLTLLFAGLRANFTSEMVFVNIKGQALNFSF